MPCGSLGDCLSERTTSAKALSRVCVWLVQGPGTRPVWSEESEQARKVAEEQGYGGPYRCCKECGLELGMKWETIAAGCAEGESHLICMLPPCGEWTGEELCQEGSREL